MSTDKIASALKRTKVLVSKTLDKTIEFKNRTADFIIPAARRAKVFAYMVKDKTADFCSMAKYKSKGYAYNSYDRIRDLLGKYGPEKKTVDLIEYKGEPEPTIKQKVKEKALSVVTSVKAKLPDSPGELVVSYGTWYKRTRRQARRIYMTAKGSCAEGYYYTKDYVSGIRKSTVAGLSAICVGGFVLVFMLSTIVSSYAMGVTINGEKVGFVENEEAFAALVEDVKQNLSEENSNADIQINEDVIELDSMAEAKDDVTMLNEDKLKEKLVNTEAIIVSGAAVTIDGQPVLYVAGKKDAYNILSSIRSKYDVAGKDVFGGFKENVSVVETQISVKNIIPTSNAISLLLTGNQVIKQHTVKGDETNWDIALANGLTEKDIKKANPGVNTDIIKEGDVLNISKMEPYVHMEVTATVDVTEKTDFSVRKVETDDLYVGETKVQSEGKRGKTNVTKRAVFVNGKETSARVIGEKVISAPKERVILVGTKEKPEEPVYADNSNNSTNSDTNTNNNKSKNRNSGSKSKSSPYKKGGDSYVGGNGTLSKPMRNMELSSPFGNRNGRRHTGADYRNPAGTPIYAAASGKVTYSGYDGAYGYTVRISHGKGMSTVYAHCKSLNVKSGAKVTTGQQIATVGRTGRATGNHLHFEVRINGTPKNPQNYL